MQDLVLRGTMRLSLFASTALSWCLMWWNKQAPQSVLVNQQARRQDLAAGGPKPEGGTTFSKYSDGCMQQPVGQTWNGKYGFQMLGRAPLAPPLTTALSTRCTLLGVSGFLGMRYRDEPYTGELGVCSWRSGIFIGVGSWGAGKAVAVLLSLKTYFKHGKNLYWKGAVIEKNLSI